VVESPDVKTIYEVPLRLHEQGLDREVCQRLRLDTPEPDLRAWSEMVEKIVRPTDHVKIAIVGKYTQLVDAYKSVQEALIHGGIANNVGVTLEWVSSDRFTDLEAATRLLAPYDALLIPGGFGIRGIEGMVQAVEAARLKRLPFFGICLGMQVAIIEFARHACGIEDANSSEFEAECGNPVISLLPSQRNVEDMGGTMRLGAYTCKLRAGSQIAKIYGVSEISERHRHRYEVDNGYRDLFAEHGMRLTGLSPDGSLVEMLELPDHPWFIGCQFHPELKSRPTRPHPLFASFIAAAHDVRRHRSPVPATEPLAVVSP
jgi:CTP synthase